MNASVRVVLPRRGCCTLPPARASAGAAMWRRYHVSPRYGWRRSASAQCAESRGEQGHSRHGGTRPRHEGRLPHHEKAPSEQKKAPHREESARSALGAQSPRPWNAPSHRDATPSARGDTLPRRKKTPSALRTALSRDERGLSQRRNASPAHERSLSHDKKPGGRAERANDCGEKSPPCRKSTAPRRFLAQKSDPIPPLHG